MADIEAIRARHTETERARAAAAAGTIDEADLPLVSSYRVATEAHADRGALLEEVDRLREDRLALARVCARMLPHDYGMAEEEREMAERIVAAADCQTEPTERVEES